MHGETGKLVTIQSEFDGSKTMSTDVRGEGGCPNSRRKSRFALCPLLHRSVLSQPSAGWALPTHTGEGRSSLFSLLFKCLSLPETSSQMYLERISYQLSVQPVLLVSRPRMPLMAHFPATGGSSLRTHITFRCHVCVCVCVLSRV